MPRSRIIVVAIGLAVIGSACAAGTGEETTTTTTGATTTTSEQVVTTTTLVETTTTAPTTTVPALQPIEIVIEDGAVVGGVTRIQSDLGSEVEIRVISDVAEHVHVHGYDLIFDLAPDQPAEVRFVADIPGIFEIELENSHRLIAELEVR